MEQTIEQKREAMIALIDETVEFYKNNPRSVKTVISNSNYCVYLGPNGEKCAFSRLLSDEVVEEIHKRLEGEPASYVIESLNLELPFVITFYDSIQTLHDSRYHWNGSKFTTEGEEYVVGFKENINNGFYDN